MQAFAVTKLFNGSYQPRREYADGFTLTVGEIILHQTVILM